MPKSEKKCKIIRDEMIQRILDRSILYFAKNGFAGTKISDLAKYIGIAQGTIYIYFESKEVLYAEIFREINCDNELKSLKLLSAMPIKASAKIDILSKDVLSKLEKEHFASMVALNTQLLLEKDIQCSAITTTYQTELYEITSKIIEQGQKEGSIVEGNSLKLADYYWGVIYLYALKRLFTSHYEMIDLNDLKRILCK